MRDRVFVTVICIGYSVVIACCVFIAGSRIHSMFS